MTTRAHWLIVFAAATLLSGPTRSQPSPSEIESIALGQQLAERNCAMCHAVGRTGASAVAKAPAFRDLHRRMDVELLGEGLAQGILTGHPSMPEFRFAPNEVVAIVRYLRSIQERQSVDTSPAAPTARRPASS